jgi:leucyl aminopeptidase (aminopeptidase T)
MLDYMKGTQSILEACAGIKPAEKWLIVADNDGRSIWIGQMAMDIMTSKGVEVVLSIINPPELEISEEPPKAIAEAMKSVNAVLRVAERNPHVHTDARRDATAAGVRYYVMKEISLEDLKRGVSIEDIQLVKEKTEKLAQRLSTSKVARVTSLGGTDLTLRIDNRPGIGLNPTSPILSTLPDYAEAAIAPVEGTAEGVVVADLAIIQWEYIFREPLRFSVKAGLAGDFSGGALETERLNKIIAANKNGNNIAELGIGTSHILPRALRGNRRDCARIGTVHIALGRNDDIGGKVNTPVHLDCLMSNAMVELDGQVVLKEGNLLL